MQIKVNGEYRTCERELSLLGLLQELGLKTERIAVERNMEIVPRSVWDQTTLYEGDRLEIIHFVGGG